MVLAAIILLARIATSYAAIDATFICSNPKCLEGTPINYSIAIENNLNYTIRVSGIKILDIQTNQTLSTFDFEKVFAPREFYRVIYEDTVIAPQQGYTFIFVPCIQVNVYGKDRKIIDAGAVCDTTEKSMTVLPLSKIQCEADFQCKNNQYCDKFYKCHDLKCENYSFPITHTCTNYNVLWTVIGMVIVLSIGATFFIRRNYKRKRK